MSRTHYVALLYHRRYVLWDASLDLGYQICIISSKYLRLLTRTYTHLHIHTFTPATHIHRRITPPQTHIQTCTYTGLGQVTNSPLCHYCGLLSREPRSSSTSARIRNNNSARSHLKFYLFPLIWLEKNPEILQTQNGNENSHEDSVDRDATTLCVLYVYPPAAALLTKKAGESLIIHFVYYSYTTYALPPRKYHSTHSAYTHYTLHSTHSTYTHYTTHTLLHCLPLFHFVYYLYTTYALPPRKYTHTPLTPTTAHLITHSFTHFAYSLILTDFTHSLSLCL